MDFYEQLTKFERDLWGGTDPDPQARALDASQRGYVLPPDVELLECVEDSNGEWVPVDKKKSLDGKL